MGKPNVSTFTQSSFFKDLPLAVKTYLRNSLLCSHGLGASSLGMCLSRLHTLGFWEYNLRHCFIQCRWHPGRNGFGMKINPRKRRWGGGEICNCSVSFFISYTNHSVIYCPYPLVLLKVNEKTSYYKQETPYKNLTLGTSSRTNNLKG